MTDKEFRGMNETLIRIDERVLTLKDDMATVKTDISGIKVHGCALGSENKTDIDRLYKKVRAPAVAGISGAGVGAIALAILEWVRLHVFAGGGGQ